MAFLNVLKLMSIGEDSMQHTDAPYHTEPLYIVHPSFKHVITHNCVPADFVKNSADLVESEVIVFVHHTSVVGVCPQARADVVVHIVVACNHTAWCFPELGRSSKPCSIKRADGIVVAQIVVRERKLVSRAAFACSSVNFRDLPLPGSRLKLPRS
jgi:hypothetical protein